MSASGSIVGWRKPSRPSKIARHELSFWYLANHLGKRFLGDVIELTGNADSVSPGLWRRRILGRPLWLLSNRDVPIDDESAPVRLVSKKSSEQLRELAKVVVSKDELRRSYSPWLAELYPDFWKGLRAMATRNKRGDIYLVANLQRLLSEYDPSGRFLKEMLAKLGPTQLLSALSPEQREELLRELQGADAAKRPIAGS